MGGEHKRGRALAWLSAALSTLVAGLLATLWPAIAQGRTFRWVHDWVPSLGIQLSFHVDGLSLLFGLLIAVIGALVALYAGAYMRGHAQFGRFFLYLMLFEAAMLGLVMADSLIGVYVFWELTTICSFLLIGFEHKDEQARRNAWQALLVTSAGGLALLAGIVLLASAGGSWQLSELRESGDVVRESALYLPILILVLIAAFTKSALFPFHFWLPNAMVAPTPVSAYLHSATMVKAGIYLLARLHPALASTPEWNWTLTLVGAFTAVWGSVLALRQTDLKLALAYSTIMALGAITMFLGSNFSVAIAAAITYLVVHALYKSALFMVVGLVDHETGTRDISRLSGLARAMPLTTIAAVAAALSMAGFPPFLGFIGKELNYKGALAVASGPYVVVVAAIAANALMVTVAGVVAVSPFFGHRRKTPKRPHEGPAMMWAAPLALAALGLLMGLTPPFAEAIVEPATQAVLDAPVPLDLELWHGINVPLLLSIFTFAAGIVMYRFRWLLRRVLDAVFVRTLQADDAYDAVKSGLLRLADKQTLMLQNGSLRRYLFVIFAVTAAGVGAVLVARGGLAAPSRPLRFGVDHLGLHHWAVVALIAAGAGLTVIARSRLAAICGLSASGAGTGLVFLLYSAPDVALAQLVIETLFLVMIAVILPRMGRRVSTTPVGHPIWPWTAAVSAATGIVVAALILAVLDVPFSLHIMDYYAANSVPEAHGENIVNVILVDFRALDTLAEIIVLATAGLGAVALVRKAGGWRRQS